MDKDHSDARTQDAPTLFLSAARLIEKALIALNTVTVECPVCARALWERLDHGRIYEQFSDVPTKLRHAAARLDELSANGTMTTSRGYVEATRQKQDRLDAAIAPRGR